MIGNTYNFEKMQKLVYFFPKVVIVKEASSRERTSHRAFFVP